MRISPQLRTDRVSLRSPRVLDSGSTVFEAVVVYAGRPLQYGWGTEVPTAEALRDPAYLANFRGTPLTIEHPNGAKVTADQPVASGPGRIAGTVLGARFDEPEQAVVVEFVVHSAKDAAIVKEWAEVSEGYEAQVNEAGEQVQRKTNHLAVVPEGRALGNEVRVDHQSGAGSMTPEQIAAMHKSLTDATERAVKAELEAKAAQVRADAAEKKAKDSEAAAVQSAEVNHKQAYKDIAQLVRAADELGVEVPEDVDPGALLMALAESLGLDAERAKNADYARGAIDAAVSARKASKAQAGEMPAAQDAAPRGDSKGTQFNARRDTAPATNTNPFLI